MSLLIAIRCDVCCVKFTGPVTGPSKMRGHLLRHEAREMGWLCAVQSADKKWINGPYDYCSACRAREAKR